MEKDKNESLPKWALDIIEENKAMKEKIKMFEDLAGKNAIASYKDGQQTFKLKQSHFKKINGKIVVGWGNLNYDKYNPNARKSDDEGVTMELIYEDGTKEVVNYVKFIRCNDLVKLDIIKTSNDIAVISMPDGRELPVNIKFLNA